MAAENQSRGDDPVPLEDTKPYVPGVQPPGMVRNFSRPCRSPIYENQESYPRKPNTEFSFIGVPARNGASASSSASNVRDGCETGNTTPNVDQQSGSLQVEASQNISLSLDSLTSPNFPEPSSSFQEFNHAISNEYSGENIETIPNRLLNRREHPVSDPPNGGVLAWAHVFAGFLVTFDTQGLNMGFGVFQAFYEKRYLPGESPSKIALIGSFQFCTTIFMCLFISSLIRKGYFWHCSLGGVGLMAAGLFFAGFCTEWWQLMLTQGIVLGLGMGLSFTSGIILMTSYFSTRLRIATVIAASGVSSGGIVFPIIVKNLIELIGFHWTMYALMLINVVTMRLANAIATPRFARRRTQRLTMDWASFKDPPYTLMMAGLFFCFWGIYFGFYFIVSYGEDILQMPPNASITLLVAMNGANFIGRFVPSLIRDACNGPVNILISSVFLASFLAFLWIGATSPIALFLVGCCYGLVAAAVQLLYPATVLTFSSPGRSGMGGRSACVIAAIGISSLTGAPLCGHLISLGNGSYLYADIFVGLSLTLGSVLLLAAQSVKGARGPTGV